MSIDKATVARIASLARIHIAEDRRQALAGELSKILGWVEQLSEVDTDHVAPMTSVVEVRLPERDDVITDGDCREDILANAPQTEGGFFVVPKVVE